MKPNQSMRNSLAIFQPLKRLGILSNKQLFDYIQPSRVAHLATINPDGTAHIVPIVFANDRKNIYFVVDRKPKSRRLRRISNIQMNQKATILIDRYSENWKNLSYTLIYAKAMILQGKGSLEEKKRAATLLKGKYHQYSNDNYFPEEIQSAIFVRLTPTKFYMWPRATAHF